MVYLTDYRPTPGCSSLFNSGLRGESWGKDVDMLSTGLSIQVPHGERIVRCGVLAHDLQQIRKAVHQPLKL